MRPQRVLWVAASATAVLGAVALVSQIGWIASVAGVGALVVARTAFRLESARAPDADPPPTDGEPTAPAESAQQHRSGNGIVDESMLVSALHGRTAIARRALRPLSIIHLEVQDIAPDGTSMRPSALIEQVLEATLRESDVCVRRADGVYVFILEETSEDGAVWTAERLRRGLAAVVGDRRFCAGVASYPSHGLTAEALDAKAEEALVAAREWRRSRIEVAVGP